MSNHFPVVDAAGGCGKVHANFEESARVVGELAGVVFRIDLGEGCVGGGICLDFNDIDIMLRLNQNAYVSALTGV